MKLADIGDLTTFRSSGKIRTVGRWSFYDNDNTEFPKVPSERVVYHYGTEMGRFVNCHEYRHLDSWYFVPTSVGWGSVSDQQGMNKILSGFGWVYRRNGGNARYERI